MARTASTSRPSSSTLFVLEQVESLDTLVLFHAAAMEHFWLFLGGVILIFGYAVSSLSSAKPPAKQKKRQ